MKKMRNVDGKIWIALSYRVITVLLAVFCCLASGFGRGVAEAQEAEHAVPTGASVVIVQPKFGGQILGYDIASKGSEGLFSEAFAEPNGNTLVATEAFDQKTGAIVKVVAKENGRISTDYDTLEINAPDLGLVLYQHAGKNQFRTLNPLSGNKFTGVWQPPIKHNYDLLGISVAQGTAEVAAYQSSFVTGLTYVFRSNIEANTFGRQISLKPIIDVDEFFEPAIALDTATNQAVLADSHGCPEPGPQCATSIALVNLSTGKISEFTDDLGVGTVNGLAVDPATGIAVTTTLVDQGVEFYNLATETGFEEIIPNSGSEIQAGLDVEFDRVHKLFLIEQYTSTGNIDDPQPRVYVYDEAGTLVETITGLQRLPVSPTRIVLNPNTRTGVLPVVVEPENLVLELQAFRY